MPKNPIWFYEEKQVGVDYLDPKIAENYDIQHQKFRNFKKEAASIVQMLNISSEDTVLDFACGTGGIALNLANHCKEVIAVDISPQMLNILEKKAEKQNIKNIVTQCAGFLTYQPEEWGKVDKIVTIAALHHLPDFWKSVALLRMAQILKPKGRLYLFDVIFTFHISHYEPAIKRLIQNMGAAAGDPMVEESIIHVKEEFSTYDWIMEGLLKRSGFIIDSQIQRDENFIAYLCTKL